MSKRVSVLLFSVAFVIISTAYKYPHANVDQDTTYSTIYYKSISDLESKLNELNKVIDQSDLSSEAGRKAVYNEVYICRKALKKTDLWTRYFEANAYRALNGPLPVEWETEVFEKFEKPYKRQGYGLTLIENSLDSGVKDKEVLKNLMLPSINAIQVYRADSVTKNLNTFDHFFLANRLFLLNLAAIYTTGFECPNNDSIIPELRTMINDVAYIYSAYNTSYPGYILKDDYLALYRKMQVFVNSQPAGYAQFDNYTFIREYVNPLFDLNQMYIRDYKVVSSNLGDYTLNANANSIFDKDLYTGQNTMGIYSGITDQKIITQIKETGKMLFYDPILSGNNERSCASCHKPTEHFTDTSVTAALNFDKVHSLTRNTPSLLNVIHNHLLMLDGKHTSLQNQARGVITSPTEMGGTEDIVTQKVLSCKEYKEAFEKLKKYTYKNKEVTFDHIISAITAYESDFSNFTAPFDDAMNKKATISEECKKGFNLFMSKAQCGTCHYIPEFNGVRPPYIESEFEVLGVPSDNKYTSLSIDSGRAGIYISNEMTHAFRTNTIRNSSYTKPYMHNGVFSTMREVIDFYNAGGGAGKGLHVKNQTLSPKPLHLSDTEIKELLAFIGTLDETIPLELPPDHLPVSKDKILNNRKIGGLY